jgi:hypothetical protein
MSLYLMKMELESFNRDIEMEKRMVILDFSLLLIINEWNVEPILCLRH